MQKRQPHDFIFNRYMLFASILNVCSKIMRARLTSLCQSIIHDIRDRVEANQQVVIFKIQYGTCLQRIRILFWHLVSLARLLSLLFLRSTFSMIFLTSVFLRPIVPYMQCSFNGDKLYYFSLFVSCLNVQENKYIRKIQNKCRTHVPLCFNQLNISMNAPV